MYTQPVYTTFMRERGGGVDPISLTNIKLKSGDTGIEQRNEKEKCEIGNELAESEKKIGFPLKFWKSWGRGKTILEGWKSSRSVNEFFALHENITPSILGFLPCQKQTSMCPYSIYSSSRLNIFFVISVNVCQQDNFLEDLDCSALESLTQLRYSPFHKTYRNPV